MTCTVSGRTVVVPQGSSLVISDGQVLINGRTCPAIGPLCTCDKAVTVTGNTGAITTVSGDVKVSGHVTGSVKTGSGDVTARSIGGGVTTISGDISRG